VIRSVQAYPGTHPKMKGRQFTGELKEEEEAATKRYRRPEKTCTRAWQKVLWVEKEKGITEDDLRGKNGGKKRRYFTGSPLNDPDKPEFLSVSKEERERQHPRKAGTYSTQCP